MNHMINDLNGNVSYAPEYMECVELKKCDVCECEVDGNITATVKEALWTVCQGCVRNIDLNKEFEDATSFEMESIINQLKPIL